MKLLLFRLLTISIVFFSCQNQDNTVPSKQSSALSVNTNNTVNKGVSKEKAIQLAEDFVRWQGYTSAPTEVTLEEALFEENEFATSIENLMKVRQNSLKGKSIGVRQFNNKTQWAIAFDFVEESEDGQCRCVIMDTLGETVFMKPGNTFIQWFNE